MTRTKKMLTYHYTRPDGLAIYCHGVLTTERAESSHGLPVYLVTEAYRVDDPIRPGLVLGPAEIGVLETTGSVFTSDPDAALYVHARDAGYVLRVGLVLGVD